MTVRFKGVTEYQQKYKNRHARSRSASPPGRMRLAGLCSDQLGISQEPQFLSKRKVPSHPKISTSFQALPQRQESAEPDPSAAAASVGGVGSTEQAATPQALKSPRHPRACSAEAPATQPPHPAAGPEHHEQALNGVEHALRRRAGLRAGRHRGVHRRGHQSSEYQRQFMWKPPVTQSPLLAAQEMLHTSSRSIPPFKSSHLVMESEYRRNFKGSPTQRASRSRRDVEQTEIPLFHKENVSPERASKQSKQRNRKGQQHNRKWSPEEDQPRPKQEEVRSRGAQRDISTQTGYRKFKTEYNSNFHSPLQYRYRDGAWVCSQTVGEEGRGTGPRPAWYHEVKDLRERAEAYRRRAWGTHFSRQHLSQILSEQNRLWEPSSATTSSPTSSTLTPGSGSASSPVIEALALARVDSDRGSCSPGVSASMATSRRGSAKEVEHDEGPTLPVQRKLAWDEDVEPQEGGGAEADQRREEPDENEEGPTEGKENEKGSKHTKNKLEVTEERLLHPAAGSGSPGVIVRLPTATQRAVPAPQRTHHDRTTPATGAAMLVSPPKPKDVGKMVRGAEPPLGKPHAPDQNRPLIKAEEGSLPSSSPVAGLSTVDPLLLGEDSWAGGTTEHSPDPTLARPSRKCSTSGRTCSTAPQAAHRIRGTLRNAEFQHNGNLGVPRPDLSALPPPHSPVSDDEDRLSQISSRSASSCSLAAQVLDRAQRRGRGFWEKS